MIFIEYENKNKKIKITFNIKIKKIIFNYQTIHELIIMVTAYDKRTVLIIFS